MLLLLVEGGDPDVKLKTIEEGSFDVITFIFGKF